jgi:hypothetical protein
VPNGYSFIFKDIVEDDDDFVGMVAYTLYKRQKIEWIEKFQADHGRRPTDDEIENGFARFSVMPSQLQSYREQAVQILDMFLDQALYAKVEEARESIRDDAIVKAVGKSFTQGVLENLVAGLAAALFTLGASGLVWVALQGPENLIRQALEKVVSDKPAQPMESAGR